MVLWSAIAVALLWRSADMSGDRAILPLPTGAMASDQLVHPPISQSFETGDYRFVVTGADEWQTPVATGQMYQGDSLLWEKPLPQQYGPRFVVVGERGQVLLVDEFINVASPYALMLLDAAGEPVATYAFEDIQQVLSVSAADLTRQATSGWWVSAAPQLRQLEDSTAGEAVLISAGGTYLVVNLSAGELASYEDLY